MKIAVEDFEDEPIDRVCTPGRQQLSSTVTLEPLDAHRFTMTLLALDSDFAVFFFLFWMQW